MSISEAFPDFLGWAASHGTSDGDWFDQAVSGKTGLPTSADFESRDWQVDLPAQ